MTLNRHYALCFKIRASSGAHCENLNEDISILSATKICLTVVSGNIRFVPIFEVVPWREGVKQQWVIENMDFYGFQRYVFGSFGNQAKAIIQ